MNILDEIIASSWLPDKDETLELFLKNAADKKYEDWDWKWDWLNLAATLADNQKHFDIHCGDHRNSAYPNGFFRDDNINQDYLNAQKRVVCIEHLKIVEA